MKALTIRNPWAWAIFNAGKDVENRGWFPKSLKPGETIAIHVAKKLVPNYIQACSSIGVSADSLDGCKRVVPAYVHDNALAGFITGLVDVVRWDKPECPESTWAMDGFCHWHLENPRLVVPVRATGRLNLWEVSDYVLESIEVMT